MKTPAALSVTSSQREQTSLRSQAPRLPRSNVCSRDVVFKLAALPKTNVEAALIARGVDPSNVGATADAIAALGIPMSAEDAYNYSFWPRTEGPSFPLGRFGDGTFAVCYSALERETCRDEVRHHCQEELAALQSGLMPFPRYYTLVSGDFRGTSLMLRGREDAYPDLGSPTTAGYPFCRAVARWSKGLGAQALHTTSARRPEGTCVPVFVRECLSNHAGVQRYRFVVTGGELICEELPPGE
jgi:hypothetical protein